jgi:hypothetical protein
MPAGAVKSFQSARSAGLCLDNLLQFGSALNSDQRAENLARPFFHGLAIFVRGHFVFFYAHHRDRRGPGAFREIDRGRSQLGQESHRRTSPIPRAGTSSQRLLEYRLRIKFLILLARETGLEPATSGVTGQEKTKGISGTVRLSGA